MARTRPPRRAHSAPLSPSASAARRRGPSRSRDGQDPPMTRSADRHNPRFGGRPAATARQMSLPLRRFVLLLVLVAIGTCVEPTMAPAAPASATLSAPSSSAVGPAPASASLSAPSSSAVGPASGSAAPSPSAPGWTWPASGPRTVVAPFRAPAHAFGAGHRGIDILAATGGPVVAPADGVVAFRGTVVDRPLLTIEHAEGFVSTLEPVESSLLPGDAVRAGQTIGVLAHGGHTPVGALHLGVRQDGAYIDPMLLFGGAPRAVLLPCCSSP